MTGPAFNDHSQLGKCRSWLHASPPWSQSGEGDILYLMGVGSIQMILSRKWHGLTIVLKDHSGRWCILYRMDSRGEPGGWETACHPCISTWGLSSGITSSLDPLSLVHLSGFPQPPILSYHSTDKKKKSAHSWSTYILGIILSSLHVSANLILKTFLQSRLLLLPLFYREETEAQ